MNAKKFRKLYICSKVIEILVNCMDMQIMFFGTGFFIGMLVQSLIVKEYLKHRQLYKQSGIGFWFIVEGAIFFALYGIYMYSTIQK